MNKFRFRVFKYAKTELIYAYMLYNTSNFRKSITSNLSQRPVPVA